MAVILTREHLDEFLFGVPANPTKQWLMKNKPLVGQAYNALDCCTMREVYDANAPKLTADTRRIYAFEHACQQPAITMALRGVLIDPSRRNEAIRAFEAEEEAAQRAAAELAADVWDAREKRVGACNPLPGYAPTKAELKAGHALGAPFRIHAWPRGVEDGEASCKRCGLSRLRPSPLNCNSSQQVAKLMFDLLGATVRRNRDTGRPTTDDEALEAIKAEGLKYAAEGKRPETKAWGVQVASICVEILKARKARKQIGYARSKVGDDGRMRSSFNVGAAETGRWSASGAPDWTGWNIQQIAERLKAIVVADPGLEIWYADLEQAESRIVAYDSGDEAYINAHHTADVHTTVCRLMWTDMDWSDDEQRNRALADQPAHFDPHHSYRDYGKRFQHGGNMGRTPQGVARQIHCTVAAAQDAYGRMYGGWGHDGAFPQIKARHRAVKAELERTGVTTSCLGRVRQFLGRTWSDDTLREALGQLEQSPVADILNLALLLVWQELDTRPNIWDAPHPSQPNRVWLLAQVHDAILGLRRVGDDAALVRVKELMTIPLEINGRICTIPVEIAVGPSWSKKEMRKWHV